MQNFLISPERSEVFPNFLINNFDSKLQSIGYQFTNIMSQIKGQQKVNCLLFSRLPVSLMVKVIAFPQEIHELFIDAIAHGTDLKTDKEARAGLRNCFQVSRSFWWRARRHFFVHVDIRECVSDADNTTVTSVDRLLRFIDLSAEGIASAPRIITLVRSCTVTSNHYLTKIWDHPAFLKLLKDFHASDSFHSLTLNTVNGIWTNIKQSTRDALHALVRTSHLRTLSLLNFGQVPSNFLDGSTLRNLHFCYVSSSGVTALSELASPPPLETIVTDNTFPVLRGDSLENGVTRFPKLKKIVFTIKKHPDTEVAYTLARGSRHLHTLELISYNCEDRVWSMPADHPFDLGQLPGLRHIKLVTHTRGTMYTEPLQRLWRFLASPLAPDTPLPLETMEFEVGLPTCATNGFLSEMNEDHWNALDNAISQPHLSRVRKVHVKAHFNIIGLARFHDDYTETALEARGKQLLNSFFPRSRSNKAIDFTVEVEGEIIREFFWPLYQ